MSITIDDGIVFLEETIQHKKLLLDTYFTKFNTDNLKYEIEMLETILKWLKAEKEYDVHMGE